MRSLNYNTILFDLDGTLLDTLDDLTDSVNELLIQQGFPTRTPREIRSFLGNGARILLARSFPQQPSAAALDGYLTLYKAIYQRNMNNKTKPYPGVMETLAALHRAGVKMAVVSNKPDWACVDLCKKTFSGLIDLAVGDRPDIPKKPAPDAVHYVLDRLSCADNCRGLYVGDSEVDIRTAKNAGLSSVGVCWGFRDRDILAKEKADFIIEHPQELLQIVGIIPPPDAK